MLEAVLFCPILRWMSEKLLADGVQRFFVVCGPRFAEEARACLPEDAQVTVSEQQRELLDFLDTGEETAVFVRAALPAAEAGPGFAYAAPGHELAGGVAGENDQRHFRVPDCWPGWLPVFEPETIAELEPLLRDRIVRRHIQNGVRVLDPAAVYIDPRVQIGRGTHVPARHHPAGRDHHRLRLRPSAPTPWCDGLPSWATARRSTPPR